MSTEPQRRGWSPHVAVLLDALSNQQRAAIPRLALAIIEGRGVAPLLKGPDKVCNHWTYWRRRQEGKHGDGWIHQPRFKRSLDAAVADLRMRAEGDVIEESVQRIRARLRQHDEWADQIATLGNEAAERLGELMRGVETTRAEWQVRSMVQAAKALNDREGRLYEQDKSRADKVLAEKESAAAAAVFLDVMAQGVASARGEDGDTGGGGEWEPTDAEVAELGVQDPALARVRVLSA